MGHIRLGKLPATRKWQQVVFLLGEDAPVADIACASAEAAEAALDHARDDPALIQAFWLLTQLPLAARSPSFDGSLRALRLEADRNPSLLDLVNALTESVDRHAERMGGRTDLGEMAQAAAAESLATVVGAELPGLFGPSAEDVRFALGKFAARDRFAHLARDFFARLTHRHLDYYLSRALPDQVGAGDRLSSVTDHSRFNEALEGHSREA